MGVEERLLLVGHDAIILNIKLVGREAHEAGDLLDGQASGQVLGALLGGQAPVLVGDELAGALEVLEREAVLLDELEAGVGRVGQAPAALLLDDRVALAAVGLGVARALGLGAAALTGRLAAREAQKARGDRGGGEEVPARDVAHLVSSMCVPPIRPS